MSGWFVLLTDGDDGLDSLFEEPAGKVLLDEDIWVVRLAGLVLVSFSE